MAASTSREVRVLDNFAKQETGKQTTLDFQKPPVADAITKQRMRNFLRKSALEGGNETLAPVLAQVDASRSEEHTSELQSLMRISYAVFCLKKKNKKKLHNTVHI